MKKTREYEVKGYDTFHPCTRGDLPVRGKVGLRGLLVSSQCDYANETLRHTWSYRLTYREV